MILEASDMRHFQKKTIRLKHCCIMVDMFLTVLCLKKDGPLPMYTVTCTRKSRQRLTLFLNEAIIFLPMLYLPLINILVSEQNCFTGLKRITTIHRGKLYVYFVLSGCCFK